jgi:hypothetical protein
VSAPRGQRGNHDIGVCAGRMMSNHTVTTTLMLPVP